MSHKIETMLTDQARAAGLVAIGFATAEPVRTHDRFLAWLAEGCHGTMAWLERNAAKRADPRLLMEGVRSVIIAAARYPRNPNPSEGFSSYAWGRDYHVVMREKLGPLAVTLREHAGAKVCRICVDTAPLAEREWALQAGIGWRGRQGQIIRTDGGACLVLGAILTDVVLTPSHPAKNRCGTCRKCVDACPTRAIRNDGTIDARRCISYLTIEHKGEIAEELQPLLGGSLFGCDRCTAICPWNRFGEDRCLPEFKRKAPRPTPSECLALDEAAYIATFTDTAIDHTPLTSLQRNARIALQHARIR